MDAVDVGTPVRFALLGCGRIGQRHAELLAGKVQGARLVAVCDVVPERAASFSKRFGVPGFTSFSEMMRVLGGEIDAVSITTPTGCHYENVLEVASYRKHVVVEKPMALTLEHADEMIELCALSGVKLFVVKQNRYNVPVQKLRQAVDAGRFGKLILGSVRVRWCRRQEYYDQDSWRGTWRWDGGVFANQASHHIDLLVWLCGEVESVFAYTKRNLVNIETEDTGVAVLKFRCGALGVVEATTATRPKDLEASLSLLGETGTVEIGGFAVNEMKIWQFAEEQEIDADVRTRFNQNPPDVYGFGHASYLADVVEAINNRAPIFVDGEEGMRSLRILNAIYESAETGREVYLLRPSIRLGLGGRRNGDPDRYDEYLREMRARTAAELDHGQVAVGTQPSTEAVARPAKADTFIATPATPAPAERVTAS